MRRLAALLACLASPAGAWEFTPLPVCTLSEAGPVSVTVTYDPRQGEPYAITVTADAPWPEAAVFGLRFEGPRGLTISTPRHRLSEDGLSLTVTDRGFGNVLDGLEYNLAATALLGDTALRFSLDGAADPVRAFRACATAPTA